MAFSDQLHIDADMDFQAGVRFAESEMKSVAMEFAEWAVYNSYQLSITGENRGKWFYTYRTSFEYLTTSELFAKFEAERQAK